MVTDTINRLRSTIHMLEQVSFEKPCTYVSSSMDGLDALLPGHGFPLGSFVEIIQAVEGCGAFALALRMARKALELRPDWVLIDPEKTFFPPAAHALGCDLSRLVVLRPQLADAAWACGQVLRSKDVGACFWSTASMD